MSWYRGVEGWLARSVERLYGVLESNRVTRAPWAVIQTFSSSQGALLSGSMAYYTFLSLLPLLLVAGSIVGTVSASSAGVREGLADAINGLLPGAEGQELVRQVIDARAAFGILGLVTVVYAGSGFVGALTACLNRMWNVPTGRNAVGQKLVNLLVVLLLGTVLLGSVGLTIWASYVAGVVLGPRAGVAAVAERVASPVSLFVVTLLLYKILPARVVAWRHQIPGAVFATVGVELLKRGFAFWADRSAGISALPRSLVTIVLLLVWMGLFAQVVLYGAAINVVWDRRRRGSDIMPRRVPLDT